MLDQSKNILREVEKQYGIKICIFGNNDFSHLEMCDNFSNEKIYDIVVEMINLLEGNNATIIYTTDYSIYFCLTKVQKNYVLFGPIASIKVSDFEKKMIYEKYEYTNVDLIIPYLTRRDFLMIINVLKVALNVNDEGVLVFSNNMMEDDKTKEFDSSYFKYQYDLIYMDYKEEIKWFDAITNANQDSLDSFEHYDESSVGLFALNPLKQREYMVVTGIVLTARAAIKGGVPPRVAYEKKEMYLQQLEKCKDTHEMIQIMRDVTYDFIEQVKLFKEGRRGSYTNQCKEYIAKNITQKIKTIDIAENIGINISYLCRVFVNDEKITIKQYILNEKMRMAAEMIMTKDITISEISDFLGFNSTSYFSKRFFDVYKMSPTQYKKAFKLVI